MKIADLNVKTLDHVIGLVDRCAETTAFQFPALDLGDLGCSTAQLSVDFLASLALVRDAVGGHDQFHTTRFAGAVFTIAVLSEVAPLPVAASEQVLVEETHDTNTWEAILGLVS